jgi:hypothetical protein
VNDIEWTLGGRPAAKEKWGQTPFFFAFIDQQIADERVIREKPMSFDRLRSGLTAAMAD